MDGDGFAALQAVGAGGAAFEGEVADEAGVGVGFGAAGVGGGGEVLAVVEDDVGEVGDAADFGEAEADVEVFSDGEGFAEAADFEGGVAAHGDGGEVEGDFVAHRCDEILVVGGEGVGAEGEAVGIGEGAGAAEAEQAGLAREAVELQGEAVGGHAVVGIEPGDEFAAGHGEELVSCGDEAFVGAAEDAQARFVDSERLEHAKGVVGGTIVNGNEFPVGDGLPLDAGDGF